MLIHLSAFCCSIAFVCVLVSLLLNLFQDSRLLLSIFLYLRLMIHPKFLLLIFMVICSSLSTLDGLYVSIHAQPSPNNLDLKFKEGLVIKTNIESKQGKPTPQVYNLLTFQGVANRWEGIELEFERKLNPKDQDMYQQPRWRLIENNTIQVLGLL